MVDDLLEQRGQRAFARVGVVARIAVAARGVEDGEVELLVVGIEADEEIEHLVEHFLDALIGAVDLVDDDDGLEAQRERLAGHELGLRHGAFGAVDQQDDAFDHGEDALDLAAEVGVAGRVDDVDARAFPLDGGRLGKDRNATLFLQIIGIHRPFFHPLVVAEGAGLAEKLIDERCLAVVDVRDDGDISQGAGHEMLSDCAGAARAVAPFARAPSGEGPQRQAQRTVARVQRQLALV